MNLTTEKSGLEYVNNVNNVKLKELVNRRCKNRVPCFVLINFAFSMRSYRANNQ